MNRAAVLIFLLIGLPGLAGRCQGQNASGYVQWGPLGANPTTTGQLDATAILTWNAPFGVRYPNVNGQGYDLVVTTTDLAQDGESILDWNNEIGWWFEGPSASKSGQPVPYATVQFNFYLQGTNIPFGVTGVDFTFQDAEVGERLRNFDTWDSFGNQIGFSFTDPAIFSYASGAPNVHQSDGSIDSGSPYGAGTQEGKWIDVNLAPYSVSGFQFQTGRVNSSYGSMVMTALGNLVPTGELLVFTGSNLAITAGPTFVSTASNAILTPSTLTGTLNAADTEVLTGSGTVVTSGSNGPIYTTVPLSQNIEVFSDLYSGSGNSLTMQAEQNIVSSSSVINLSSTTGAAGAITLGAVIQSVVAGELDATSSTGAGGAITITAGNSISVTGGIDTSSLALGGEGGAVTLLAGNAVAVDSIRSGGGGTEMLFGTPGDITVSASNAISVGALYDDSNVFAGLPSASLTAQSISLGVQGAVAADITGTLTLQKPAWAAAATVAITGTVTGAGGLVLDTGTGFASMDATSTYAGDTDVLSGALDLEGFSLPQSAVVLDPTGALAPEVATAGGHVTVASLSMATGAALDIALSSTSTYDQVQSTGPAMIDGILNLTVAPGYVPAIGQVFQILSAPSVSGSFATYQGLRLADRVLVPVYTGTSVDLVTTAIPSGASLPLQSVPPTGLPVSAGASYDGLSASLPTTTGTYMATLLDGTASQATTVTIAPAASGTTTVTLQGSLGGAVAQVLGTGTDKVVVQLDYNEAAALAATGDERQIYLASTDGSSQFANAVLANTDLPGEANNPTEVFGAYDPSNDFHLGYYGVDTVNNRVWAVVDYDALFGLGALDVSATPAGPAVATEPATGVLATSATLNALVDFNDFDPVTPAFESGTDPTMTSGTLNPVYLSGSGSSFFQVSYPLTGLTPATTYYFRADDLTPYGNELGGILSFTTPQSALAIWRYTYFGTYSNSGNAADSASPSGDGITNLMKYATGMSPLVASAASPAALGQSGTGGGACLALTFHRIADPSLTYTVQATGSLSGPWTTIWSSTGAANVAGSVTVPDCVPMSRQSGRFLRLQVSY